MYPSHFRQHYEEEITQLLRDRFRNERGPARKLRLGFDLTVDFFLGLPQAYRTDPVRIAASPVPQHVESIPPFRVLTNGHPGRGPLLLGSAVTLASLGLFSLPLSHLPPYQAFSALGKPASPIVSVLERLNLPAPASLYDHVPSEAGAFDAKRMALPKAHSPLPSALAMPAPGMQNFPDVGTVHQRKGSTRPSASINKREQPAPGSNPPPEPEKPGTAQAVAVSSALGQSHLPQIRDQSQQTPDQKNAANRKLQFEVASIRPGKPGTFMRPSFALDESDAYLPADPHGIFTAEFPLPVYITFAYEIRPSPAEMHSMFEKLPRWVTEERFVIHARAPGDPTKAQMRLMMQSLLADRFGLQVHFEDRILPAFALVLKQPGKTGPKLRPHADGPPCPASAKRPAHGWIAEASKLASAPNGTFPPFCGGTLLIPGPNRTALLGSRDATMKDIAATLAGISDFDRPWVNQTGLNGKYDFSIQWARKVNPPQASEAEVPPEPLGPTFLQALGDQLGLKLKSTKAPVETLVIDHIHEPTPN